MSQTLDAVRSLTPKRRIDLWKRDDANAVTPIVIMGHGAWVKLNHVAALIWESCDSRTTVGQIVECVLARFPDVPRDTVAQDVVEFLEAFDRKGLIVLAYDPLSG